VVSVGYTQDAAGQLASRTVGTTTRTYGYTSREQLASDTTGGTSTAYAQDAADNPTTVGATTQAFDAAGQLCWSVATAVTGATCAAPPANATTYTYDSAGNRTRATPAVGASIGYGYDQAGRMTSFTGTGGSATYAYNGIGQRTTKTVGGATSSFTWDDETTPNILTDGTATYLYGPDGLPIEQTTTAGTYWFVHDQIGSTVALLDATGQVAGTYTEAPYGSVTHTGGAATPLQFAGQYTDSESGLVDLRARYYDPATAEFLSIDPAVTRTLNPYGYAGDNPLNRVDPLGLAWYNPLSWTSGTWGDVAAGAGVLAGLTLVCVATACIGDVAALAGATTLGESLGFAETVGNWADLAYHVADAVGSTANIVSATQDCTDVRTTTACLTDAAGFALGMAGDHFEPEVPKHSIWNPTYKTGRSTVDLGWGLGGNAIVDGVLC
jgi:RHS repeat-associated protein